MVLAEVWHDIRSSSGSLNKQEATERGFNRFLMAMHWLWIYPKNAELLASRFQVCESYCQGKPLWKWIKRIAALKEKKIVWNPALNDPNTEINIVSADGVDFRTWEIKHELYNMNTKACSHKHNHCAAKYIVALSLFGSKCVFISGPYIGGVGDLEMMEKSGLLAKLKAIKKIAHVDRGFHSKNASDRKVMAYPNNIDPQDLHRFKSRGRLRHETFNGRMKFFKSLSDTFEHGHKKHKYVFEAIAVIVQYHMDLGAPLFDV